MEFILSQKWQTHTSNGIVSKGIYIKNGTEYLVKGNSEEGYLEPYSEVIASRIAVKLGLDAVEYDIRPKEVFPEIKVYGRCDHVSICKMLPYNIEQFYDFASSYYGKSFQNYLDTYLKLNLSINHLWKMLLLDAFVGNKDRHLNNFDVMMGEDGKLKNAPILDTGASLLFDVPDIDLKIYTGNEIGPDISKPFKDTHDKQLQYVGRYVDEKIVFNIESKDAFLEEIYKDCDYVFKELGERREKAVKSYIDQRYDRYVEPYNNY